MKKYNVLKWIAVLFIGLAVMSCGSDDDGGGSTTPTNNGTATDLNGSYVLEGAPSDLAQMDISVSGTTATMTIADVAGGRVTAGSFTGTISEDGTIITITINANSEINGSSISGTIVYDTAGPSVTYNITYNGQSYNGGAYNWTNTAILGCSQSAIAAAYTQLNGSLSTLYAQILGGGGTVNLTALKNYYQDVITFLEGINGCSGVDYTAQIEALKQAVTALDQIGG